MRWKLRQIQRNEARLPAAGVWSACPCRDHSAVTPAPLERLTSS